MDWEMTPRNHAARREQFSSPQSHRETQLLGKPDIGRKVVEFAFQPLTLRIRDLILRTVQDKQQAIGSVNRIVSAVLQIWKVPEIIIESDLVVSVRLVIAERRKDRDVLLTPHAGFAVVSIGNEAKGDGDVNVQPGCFFCPGGARSVPQYPLPPTPYPGILESVL
jgi:hypothetical protein